MPHFSRYKTFKCLGKPSKIWVSISNSKHRYMHGYKSTLRKCHNFNRKIAKHMKLFNLLNIICVRTQCGIHNTTVVRHYDRKRLAEKLFIKVVNKISLNESLESKHYKFVPSLNPTHSRSKVGYRFGYALRKHFSMNCLIKVY